MIFYFSGTGNSKYVAERIAAALSDEACSIDEADCNVELKNGESLGFVSFTAWFQIPPLMRQFIENMHVKISSGNYLFYVATYGSSPGFHGDDARKLISKLGLDLNAEYSVRMPDTWTPVFDLSDKSVVSRINEEAEVYIDNVIKSVSSRKNGNQTERRVPYFIKPFTTFLLNKERKTKKFYVEDSCVSCGLCVKKCPVQAIEMKDKKPSWVKSECTLCLRCLHHCPMFAIQYGSGKTKKHGQYCNPHVKV